MGSIPAVNQPGATPTASAVSAVIRAEDAQKYYELGETRVHALRGVSVEIQRGEFVIAERAQHFPSQMSGGQQQRVAIARALVNHPSILLADEPTGNLDSRTSVEIMEIFQKLIVLVTHEHDIAQFAKRVLVFRDGRIRKDDPVLSRPRAGEVLGTLPTLED
jgi:ABC-type lipoprotein export system ATPase subunit